MADARQPRDRKRRRRNRIALGVAIGVVVCLAGGGVAWASLRPHGPSYRLAAAERSDVTQTASLAGTVTSATRADRAFQVAGTVAAVKVKVGDTVTAGQTLATLDTSVLDDAVTQAQQAVTTAEQTLDDDLASQTASAATVDASASAAVDSTDATSGALTLGTFTAASIRTAAQPAAGGGSVDDALAAVTTAQNTMVTDSNAVTTAQNKLTQDLAQISTADGSTTACYQFLQAKVSTTDPTQAQTDIENATKELQGCQSDVQTVLDDEQAVAAAQQKVQNDVTTLNDAVTALQKAVKSAASSPAPTQSSKPQPSKSAQPKPSQSAQPGQSGNGQSGNGQSGNGRSTSDGSGSDSGQLGSGATGGTGSGSGQGRAASGSGSSGGSASGGSASGGSLSGGSSSRAASTPATAEQIAADQASVAAAQANLAVAQQNVGLTTLTSPISGTVAAVGLTAGSSVTAKSTSQTVSVIGDDGWIVDTAVSAGSVGPLKVGQTASVNVSGTTKAVTGKVAAIGFLNTATDASSPSYDVTVSLDGAGTGLLNGASARLAVKVDTASGVLTVPSSAVHLGAGNADTVEVLSGGKLVTKQVKVGAVGADRTQIESGLSAGDEVVLADLSSTVSSDSTQTGGGFGARFAGGGTGTGGALNVGGGLGTGGGAFTDRSFTRTP